jgi:putative sigma-54 modulation protein
MRSSITLTFRHIDHSGALEARARELGDRLQRYGESISRCHMTLEGTHSAHHAGGSYNVHIALSVPGAQIHADSLQGNGAGHADIYAALREAYNNAKRQLQELHARRYKSAGRAAIEQLGATPKPGEHGSR